MIAAHHPYDPGDALSCAVGLISDTHGSLDPRIPTEFRDVSLIVHAGDIGVGVLEELEQAAPVVAVEGNMDTRALLSATLRPSESFVHCGKRFYVVHDFDPISEDPPPDVDIVVAGHTHMPETLDLGTALLVNPGSASRSRTPDGVNTAAIMDIDGESVSVRTLFLP